jgi:hypothetical protein
MPGLKQREQQADGEEQAPIDEKDARLVEF